MKRRSGICPKLWDSVFINYNGDVYSCCIYQPAMIGNIYKEPLSKIWKDSEKLKEFRSKSLNGNLPCYSGCSIFFSEEYDYIDYFSYEDYPRRIWVLFSELCNLSCVMCGLNHKSTEFIDVGQLKKNIEWDRIEEIVLQGGEILVMAGAKDFYLWLTKKMGKKANLITNGSLITDEWAKNFVEGSNCIQISVNAATKEIHEFINKGSNFEKVIENIKKLIYYKNKLDSSISIVFKYTIIDVNVYEIADAVILADSLGCDTIQFGYDVRLIKFLDENQDMKKRIKKELSSVLSKNLRIKIGGWNLVKLGLL